VGSIIKNNFAKESMIFTSPAEARHTFGYPACVACHTFSDYPNTLKHFDFIPQLSIITPQTQ
jgi:hypothetical protein